MILRICGVHDVERSFVFDHPLEMYNHLCTFTRVRLSSLSSYRSVCILSKYHLPLTSVRKRFAFPGLAFLTNRKHSSANIGVNRESFMYNRIVEVLHGIWSLIVSYLEYPINPEGRRKHDI